MTSAISGLTGSVFFHASFPRPRRLLPLRQQKFCTRVLQEMADKEEIKKKEASTRLSNKQEEEGDMTQKKETEESGSGFESETEPPPEAPLPGDCCGSGCVRCVWDIYYEELEDYNNRQQQKRNQNNRKKETTV